MGEAGWRNWFKAPRESEHIKNGSRKAAKQRNERKG
jgi:hypothetical protein